MKTLSFDGKGINDCTDPHKPRVATFSSPKYSERFGKLFEAAPELAQALKDCLSSIHKGSVEYRTANEALAKAGIQ